MNFTNTIGKQDIQAMHLNLLGANLSPQDQSRLAEYKNNQNFYDGYHWETIPETGKSEVTKNYCRAFVDKYVSFELGKGFSIKMKPEVEKIILPFLNNVWEDNKKDEFLLNFGQDKSINGESFTQVIYQPKYLDDNKTKLNPDLFDPYNEYPNGRIRIVNIHPTMAFPVYGNGYDKEEIIEFTKQFPIKLNPNDPNSKTVLYKQVWTRKEVTIYHGEEKVKTLENRYGMIPFFKCKNLPASGAVRGQSDLEDLIPLNMELNIKSSDVSEIIDYYASPVTLVFGAKVGQLERGVGKIWGGLPSTGDVKNLELSGDLTASTNYIKDIKEAMHEISGVPVGALGNMKSISNTSGVALQVIMLPLIERINKKRAMTASTISDINKYIIKIALEENMLDDLDEVETQKLTNSYSSNIYYNEILFEDSLPKDKLVELQAIQLEMKLGLEDRAGGMTRLGKSDIEQRLTDIDIDRKENPTIYGLELDEQGELVLGSKMTTGKDIMRRDLNTNKDGNDGQVNAGYQNSQVKQPITNSK